MFLVVVGVALFAIGEWRGLYLGILGQTPVVTYKTDHTAQSTRRTISATSLPLNLTGELQNGSLTVTVSFERPASFQTGATAVAGQTVFERTFRRGERIALNELIQEGVGVYTVWLDFDQATGYFRLRLPTGAEL